MPKLDQRDIIVVGGAAAGLTAAIYCARLGLRTLVITKDIGGQALLTNEIQNYPGFTNTSGFDLMNKFQEQAQAYGADFVYDEVVEIREAEQNCFALKTAGEEFYSCAIVLAFGKTPRDLGVPGEQQLKGKGVSYCAVCDGPLFKGKTMVVVGAGDPALDAASYLASLAGKLHVIQRVAEPIGDEELIASLRSRSNVSFVPNSKVVRINGEKKVQSLTVRNLVNDAESEIVVDGVFIEMGYVAKTEFVKDLVLLNGRREVITDKEGRTSHPGVFAAGDVTDTPYKQVVVSAGQGCAAALSAYNHVQRLRGRPAVTVDWKSIPVRGGA